MKKALFTLLGMIIFAAIVAGLFLRSPKVEPVIEEPPAGTVCTQEAKICPDGTAVGRTGPNCSFAPCPQVPAPTIDGDDADEENGVEFDMGIGDGSPLSADGKACVAQGGSWNPQYEECVGIRERQCAAIGGAYNACASACRHQPDAQVCTLQCVEVCQL